MYPVNPETRKNRRATIALGFIIGAGVCYLIIVILTTLFTASAHSPEQNSPEFADWFRSLTRPDFNGGSCCNEKDCVTLTPDQVKIENGVYMVYAPDPTYADSPWLVVPAIHILKRPDNPTNKYVACLIGRTVACFVIPTGI